MCKNTNFNNLSYIKIFSRRRRKKALLRVNDREGGWRTCILAFCRVCVCVCVGVCACACPSVMSHARLKLTYVAMALLCTRSQLMIFNRNIAFLRGARDS